VIAMTRSGRNGGVL